MNIDDLRDQIRRETGVSQHEAHIAAYRLTTTGADFIALARKIQAADPTLTFRQAKLRAANLLRQGDR